MDWTNLRPSSNPFHQTSTIQNRTTAHYSHSKGLHVTPGVHTDSARPRSTCLPPRPTCSCGSYFNSLPGSCRRYRRSPDALEHFHFCYDKTRRQRCLHHNQQTRSLEQMGALKDLMNNQRCIGIPCQISWIATFDDKRPGYIPSRTDIIRSRAIALIGGYIFRQIWIAMLWQRIHFGFSWLINMNSWLNYLYVFGDLLTHSRVVRWRIDRYLVKSFRSNRTEDEYWMHFWHHVIIAPSNIS